MSFSPTYRPPVTDRYIGSSKVSFSAPIVFAMCFFASLLAKFFEGNTANAIQAGAMLFLMAYSWSRPKQFSISKIPGNYILSLSLIVCATLFLGLMGSFGGLAPKQLSNSVLFKSAGTVLTLLAMVVSAPAFTHRDLVRGLLLFSVIEGSMCLGLFYVGTEINANALAVRLSVCAMTVFALSESKYIKLFAVAVCVLFSFMLQCRTSLCALVGAIVFMYVERHTRKNRTLVLFVVPIATALLWLSLPLLTSTIKNVAVANLGSDNIIASFFLSDKSSAKIENDLLDRSSVWEYSLEHIKRKPWLGHGIGTENAIMGARSHNAFLSLLFEGGILNFFVWGWFYYLTIVRFFDRNLIKRAGDVPLFFLSNLLIGYMLLAGMVETSGLASVATPINLIFIFLIIWLFSPRPKLA